MSDKHDRKKLKTKAKMGDPMVNGGTAIEPEIKAAAGGVQQDLAKIRKAANNAHRG